MDITGKLNGSGGAVRTAAFTCIWGVLLVATTGSALADSYHATAQVIASRPVYQQVVEPRRECSSQLIESTVQTPRRADFGDLAGPVIGGVAGGVIGSQVGNGGTAATVAGAVAGTIAGTLISGPNRSGRLIYMEPRVVERVVERCRTVNYRRNVITGYDVIYRYRGSNFTTLMPYDPGRQIRVAVTEPRGGRKQRGERRYSRDDDRNDFRVVVIERSR